VSYNKIIIGTKSNLVYTIATVLYTCIAFGLLSSVNIEIFTKHAADAESWIEPAKGFSEQLAFVDPDDPAIPMNFRPPAYPFFVAIAMITAGSWFPLVVVVVQLILHFGTAVVTSRLMEYVQNGMGPLAFSLILFNPNSFGSVFFVQSETLNAFFVVLIVLGLFQFYRKGSFSSTALTGIAVGLVSLTRPEGKFLMILVPLGLLLLGLISRGPTFWVRNFKQAFFCLIISVIITAPWMFWNLSQGDGYRLSAGSTEYFIWGSATQIEMEQYGISGVEAEHRVREKRAEFINNYGDRWFKLSRHEQDALLVESGLRHILNYDLGAIIRNITKANLQFFVAGGAGKLFALVGKANAAPFAVMVREEHSDYLDSVMSALAQADITLIVIWLVAIIFVICTRIFGLIGLIHLYRQRHYDVLLISAAGIVFFAMVNPFFGISRFRINVECLFILLAISGIVALLKWLKIK